MFEISDPEPLFCSIVFALDTLIEALLFGRSPQPTSQARHGARRVLAGVGSSSIDGSVGASLSTPANVVMENPPVRWKEGHLTRGTPLANWRGICTFEVSPAHGLESRGYPQEVLPVVRTENPRPSVGDVNVGESVSIVAPESTAVVALGGGNSRSIVAVDF